MKVYEKNYPYHVKNKNSTTNSDSQCIKADRFNNLWLSSKSCVDYKIKHKSHLSLLEIRTKNIIVLGNF